MSSTLGNFAILLTFLVLAILGRSRAYNIPVLRRDDIVNTATSPQLVSKVLVQSPTLDNIYMDYLVTSKPLQLRKYNNKIKKTKKDSKIYFIPIPPLPYRFIPGIGYDYQPMKIKPIMQESAHSTTQAPKPSTMDKTHHRTPTTAIPSTQSSSKSPSSSPSPPSSPSPTTLPQQSKLYRVQHHKDYYFNGRPFRLQVAHADRKSSLTPLNLKSRFYYNKNIIY